MQDQRIDERVDDEIVFLIGRAQEMASVIEMRHDARIAVRMIGMVVAADVLDDGVDLDRIDVLGAEFQRVGEIVARPRADDEHVLKGLAAAVLLQQMNQ